MVSRELEGLYVRLKNARLNHHIRSYGNQRNSFYLRAEKAAQKTSSNIFQDNKK
jgi:hypothetical protein